jgi:hypothetical protein
MCGHDKSLGLVGGIDGACGACGSDLATGCDSADFQEMVEALDEIYASVSNVAALVTGGRLAPGDVAGDGLSRRLVTNTLVRAGTAARFLIDRGFRLPPELMLPDLARGLDLVRGPADHIGWDAVEEVAFLVLPRVAAYCRPLYWRRWDLIAS